MSIFIRYLLCSAGGSALIAAIFVVNRIFEKRLPKSVQFAMYIPVALVLLIPFHIDNPNPELTIPDEAVTEPWRPESFLTAEDGATMDENDPPPLLPSHPAPTQHTAKQGLLTSLSKTCVIWLPALWLLGVALSLLRKLRAYRRTHALITRQGTPESVSEPTMRVYRELLRELRICNAPLLVCGSLHISPCLFGNRIYLPFDSLAESELRLILLHELTHYRRRDRWWKLLWQAACIVHWFNPLVYFMRREADRLCELSCDEAVLRQGSDSHLYAKMLLDMCIRLREEPAVLRFKSHNTEQRIREILHSFPRKLPRAVGVVLMVALVAVCSLVGNAFGGLAPQPTTEPGAVAMPSPEPQMGGAKPPLTNEPNDEPTQNEPLPETDPADNRPQSAVEPAVPSFVLPAVEDLCFPVDLSLTLHSGEIGGGSSGQGWWGPANMPEGAPVFAVSDGVVSEITDLGGGASLVRITHGNDFTVSYKSVFDCALQTGQSVQKNEVIGTTAHTGNDMSFDSDGFYFRMESESYDFGGQGFTSEDERPFLYEFISHAVTLAYQSVDE